MRNSEGKLLNLEFRKEESEIASFLSSWVFNDSLPDIGIGQEMRSPIPTAWGSVTAL